MVAWAATECVFSSKQWRSVVFKVNSSRENSQFFASKSAIRSIVDSRSSWSVGTEHFCSNNSTRGPRFVARGVLLRV